jgi:hypothetical protein
VLPHCATRQCYHTVLSGCVTTLCYQAVPGCVTTLCYNWAALCVLVLFAQLNYVDGIKNIHSISNFRFGVSLIQVIHNLVLVRNRLQLNSVSVDL